MATKLFLRNTTTSAMGAPGRFDLSTTAGASIQSAIVNTSASGTNIQWTDSAGGTAVEWITPPLSAGFTLATTDTLTFNIWGVESSMNANAGARVHIFRLGRFESPAEFGGSPYDDGVEIGTSVAALNWTATVSSNITFLAGDRIGVRFYITNVGTMGGGFTCTMNYNANTGGANGDTWVQLNNNVTFSAESTPVDVLTRWKQKPDAGTNLVSGHPLCPDFAWLAGGGTRTHNGRHREWKKGRHGLAYNTDNWGADGAVSSIQTTGGGLRMRMYGDSVRFPNSNLIFPSTLTSYTIVLAVRRNVTTHTAPGYGTWFFDRSTGLRIRFTDSIDWLSGDSATHELGSGAVSDDCTGDSIYAFSYGSRGMEIWRDGLKIASNGAFFGTMNTPGNDYIGIGSSAAEASDDATFGFCYIYFRQLTPAQIIAISRDPY